MLDSLENSKLHRPKDWNSSHTPIEGTKPIHVYSDLLGVFPYWWTTVPQSVIINDRFILTKILNTKQEQERFLAERELINSIWDTQFLFTRTVPNYNIVPFMLLNHSFTTKWNDIVFSGKVFFYNCGYYAYKPDNKNTSAGWCSFAEFSPLYWEVVKQSQIEVTSN